MPTSRLSHLAVLLAAGAVAFGAAGCSTDDAAKKDAKNAGEEVEKSNADEKVEKGVEDVDGN